MLCFFPDSANIPRKRDSGNWSGDRNSASSSSSTSLENTTYPYIISKHSQQSPNYSNSSNHRVPNSPQSKQLPSINGAPEYANLGINPSNVNNVNAKNIQQQLHSPQQKQQSADPGYDSYSLSSNDSYPLQQSVKHNLQVKSVYFESVSMILYSLIEMIL